MSETDGDRADHLSQDEIIILKNTLTDEEKRQLIGTTLGDKTRASVALSALDDLFREEEDDE